MLLWRLMVQISGSIDDGTDVWIPSWLAFPSEIACQSGIEDVQIFGDNPLQCQFVGYVT